jgi:hypothetical protein
MTALLLICLAALAALPRVLHELPSVIDAMGRYKLVVTAARLRREKSGPSSLRRSK